MFRKLRRTSNEKGGRTALDAVRPCDFGLARLSLHSCACKTACGTPSYLAPEVAVLFKQHCTPTDMTGHGYDERADMWSLGVVLYNMLGGEQPFEQENLLDNIITGDYDFPIATWDAISPTTIDLVKQLFNRKPEDRLTAQRARDRVILNISQQSVSC